MKSILTRATFSALCIAAMFGLPACATPSSQPSTEDLLSAAGFKIKLADTPDKRATLQKLPPLQFVHREVHGKSLTLYADPGGCKCVYVGDQTAWQGYQQGRRALNGLQANEEAANLPYETQMMNQDKAAMGQFGESNSWVDAP